MQTRSPPNQGRRQQVFNGAEGRPVPSVLTGFLVVKTSSHEVGQRSESQPGLKRLISRPHQTFTCHYERERWGMPLSLSGFSAFRRAPRRDSGCLPSLHGGRDTQVGLEGQLDPVIRGEGGGEREFSHREMLFERKYDIYAPSCQQIRAGLTLQVNKLPMLGIQHYAQANAQHIIRWDLRACFTHPEQQWLGC